MPSDNNPKKVATLRKIGKIGLIGLISSLAVIIVIVVFSFIPKTFEGFTITLDNPTKDAHFTMQQTPEGNSGTTYLVGTPIKKAYVTTAEKVVNYINTFDLDSIGGSHNMDDDDPMHEGYQNAIVYTCFLSNTSSSDEQIYSYAVDLDGLQEPINGVVSPLSYLRILCITSTVDDSKDINKDLKAKFFAYPNQTGYGTDEGVSDSREAIAVTTYGKDEHANTVRSSNESYFGERYCENFSGFGVGEHLFSVTDNVIPAGRRIRFTFIAYFEGADRDCKGGAPEESHLLMSLHFGV